MCKMVRARFGTSPSKRTTSTTVVDTSQRKRFSVSQKRIKPQQAPTLTPEQQQAIQQRAQLTTSLEQRKDLAEKDLARIRAAIPGTTYGVLEGLQREEKLKTAELKGIEEVMRTLKTSDVTKAAADRFITDTIENRKERLQATEREREKQLTEIARAKEIEEQGVVTREEVVPQQFITKEQGRARVAEKARETRLLASPLSETPEFGVVGPQKTFDESVKVSGLQATKTFITRLPKATGDILGSIVSGNIFSEGLPRDFKDPFEDFKSAGTELKDTSFPGFEGGTKKFTIGTPETTPIEFTTISPVNDLTFQEAADLGIPVGDLSERTGARVVGGVKTGATIGAISVVSATSPFAAGAIGTTFASIGLGFLGEAIAPAKGGSIEGLQMQKDETMDDFQSRQTALRIKTGAKGALFLGGGIAGIGGAISASQAAVDVAALEDLSSAKFKILGVEKGESVVGGGQFFKIKAFRQAGEASQVVTFEVPVFKTGAKTFSLTGGKAVSKTRLFSYQQEKFLTGEQSFNLFARGEFAGFKDFKDIEQVLGSGGIIETTPGGIKLSVKTKPIKLGKGIIRAKGQPQIKSAKIEITTGTTAKEFQEFRFGSLVGKDGDLTRLTTGELKKIKLKANEFFVTRTSGGTTKIGIQTIGGENPTIFFDPQASGAILKKGGSVVLREPSPNKILSSGKIQDITGSGILRVKLPGFEPTVPNALFNTDKIVTQLSKSKGFVKSGFLKAQLISPTRRDSFLAPFVFSEEAAAASVAGTVAGIVGKAEITKLSTPIITTQTFSTGVSTISPIVLAGVSSESKVKQDTKIKQISISRTKTFPATDTRIRTISSTIGGQSSRNIQQQNTLLRTLSSQQQKQVQQSQQGFGAGFPNINPRIDPRPTPPKEIIGFGFSFKGKSKPIAPAGKFSVQVRRGGKFKTIARGQSFSQAMGLGSKRVSNTLAAQFRLKGFGKQTGFKLPGTIKQRKGKRLTFLEVPGARLSSAGEIKEIQLSKLSKGRIKL